jgi:hypothetical protein
LRRETIVAGSRTAIPFFIPVLNVAQRRSIACKLGDQFLTFYLGVLKELD